MVDGVALRDRGLARRVAIPGPPVKISRGATPRRQRSIPWSMRARNTGDGRPAYWAAPITTIAATGRAVSRCPQTYTPTSDNIQPAIIRRLNSQPSRHQFARRGGSIRRRELERARRPRRPPTSCVIRRPRPVFCHGREIRVARHGHHPRFRPPRRVAPAGAAQAEHPPGRERRRRFSKSS